MERKFNKIEKTQVDCSDSCLRGGKADFGTICSQPYLLHLEANGQDVEQYVVWCNNPSAPLQDDKEKSPRACVKLNEGIELREV